MIKHHYDEAGLVLIRTEEATPKCGDYCDNCGDCMHCLSENGCPESKGGGEHFWVVYGDETKDGQ